jgi:hypothetical protein
MRRAWALLLGLLGVLPAGCLSAKTAHTTAWLGRPPLAQTPTEDNLVVMHVALIEVPVGDRFINEELWKHVDEQVIALQHRPTVDENGLRIAQVGGINPHRLLLHAGDTQVLQLGPEQPECQFELHQNGRDTHVSLEKAQCQLSVKPTLTRDGRTRLQFTPRIEHGDPIQRPRPTRDPSGVAAWVLTCERPMEIYGSLSWEVTLAPNEYIVVGARFEKPGTLGPACFIHRDPQAAVQRLLVLRTARSLDAVATASSEPEEDAGPRAAPVALQAALGGS